MLRFRFPIVIIDEDYRSENTSGLGIRALAKAIEGEGFEVVGATSYGDLSQFAQQQSRASAFILSIDDEEFTPGADLAPAVENLTASDTSLGRRSRRRVGRAAQWRRLLQAGWRYGRCPGWMLRRLPRHRPSWRRCQRWRCQPP